MTIANTTIQLKKSGVSGNVPNSLDHGELAINFYDGKLYYKNADDVITYISGGIPTNSFATVNANSSLILATSNNDTLSIAAGNNITISACTVTKTITINSQDSDIDQFARNTGNSALTLAQDAYNYANTISGGSAIDNVARTLAQSAFDKANLSITFAQSAYDQSNVSIGVDATQNTRLDGIEGTNLAQNSSISIVQGVDLTQNNRIAIIEGVDLGQNTTITAVNQFAGAGFNTANQAFNQANAATNLAQQAYDQANTGGGSGTTVTISNDNTSNNIYYINFTANTSGTANTLFTSNNNLTFNPSTGTIGVKAIDLTANTNISANTIDLTDTSQVTIDSFSTSVYRSVFYQVQLSSPSGFHMLNLNIIHNGTTVFANTFGDAFSSSSLGSFTGSIVGTTLNVLFTPTNSSVTVSFIRNLIAKIGVEAPSGSLGFVGDPVTATFNAGFVEDSVTATFDYGTVG